MRSKLVAALFVWSSLAVAQQPQQRRIVRPIDNASVVRLQGTLAARARADLDRGPVAAAMPIEGMTIVFSRTPAQQAGLDQLLAEQQDQNSPNYHKWLTPEEFGDRFGLAEEDVKYVAGWLITQGFTVTEISRSRTWISFGGNAAQVEAAFRASIHSFLVDGVMHYAPSTEAAVPDALSGVIAAISGLNDFRPRLHSRVRHVNPQLTSSLSGNHFLAPGDFGTIYNLPDYANGVFQAGNDGSGQTIGVVGQTSGTTNGVAISTVSSDTFTFRSVSNLPSANLNLVAAGSATQFTSSEAEEANLDVQWAGSIAPNAAIILAYSNNALTTSLQYLVNQGGTAVPVISISFGDCEANFNSTDYATIEGYLSQANAQGQSVFAAAGDNGATDCDGTAQNPVTTATHGLAVDYPASSIYVTAIGGTEFTGDGAATVTNGVASATQYWNGSSTANDTSASAFSYIPETTWNDTFSSNSNHNVATGGGVSKQFNKPPWQTGNAVPPDGRRDVPDVSLASSPNHDGFIICSQGECQTGYRRNSDQSFTVIGGTSAAVPAFAGIAALINQKLGGRQGNLNPKIYSLAASSSWAFNDITTGDNKVVCTVGTTDCSSSPIGFSAGAGYDLVTGWGSVDVTALLDALTSSPNPHFVLLPNSRNVSLNPGDSNVVAVSVTPKEGFSGSVALACTPSSSLTQVTCSYDNTMVVTPGSANLTIQSSSSQGAQTGTVTLQGTSGSNSASVDVTVNGVVHDFTLTVSSSVVSIPSGGTITDNLTVTPTGGFNSDVALSCSVPSSLGTTTCTISPATVTGGSGTALLTLKGAVLGMDRGAPRPFQHRGLGLYATLVFALGMVFTGNPLRGRRARRASRNALMGLLLSCVTFGAVSCGGGGGSGSSGSNPTPLSGNVTITATSESVTHTATINVTVQ